MVGLKRHLPRKGDAVAVGFASRFLVLFPH
jgi:hypothetical protein